MAAIQATCPHCDTQNNSFPVVHARVWPLSPEERMIQSPTQKMTRRISAQSYCIQCNNPVGFVLFRTGTAHTLAGFDGTATALVTNSTGIQPLDLTVESVFPTNIPHRTPQHLPPHIKRAFEQGEQNYKLKNPDAAVAMYAKALEAGLRWRFPGIKGMLNEMIGTLLTKKLLPPEIGDWAHQVRLVRKDAVHDGDELTDDDMEAGRNFADAVLRYTITFPTDVAVRRGRPPESILPGWTSPEEGA